LTVTGVCATFDVMPMEPTKLERDILCWIAEHSEDEAICKQLSSYKVIGRKFSEKGSITQLKVVITVPTSLFNEADCDPYIESPKLKYGGGCVLFLKYGYIEMLEIYANEGNFPVGLDNYELKGSSKG